jgi:maltose/moltooligosaccharide transporter
VFRSESSLQRYALTSGELGSAGGQTLIAVLLPVLLAPHAPATFMIGAVIASEGVFALFLPYVAGAASDSLPTQYGRSFGRRGRLLVIAAPVMAVALVLIAFLDGFWRLAGAAVLYFLGLHLYSGPLRALLIDVTPERRWGSVQGVLGAMHLGGVGFGLVAGGLLYAAWQPLPFLVAAGLVVVLTAVTLVAARRLGETGTAAADRGHDTGHRQGIRGELRFLQDLLRSSELRWFLLANVLWNSGVEGIRPFIFLFAAVSLGIAIETASLAMFGFLGAAAVGSVLVGWLGDRWGRRRTLILGAILTGTAMLPGLVVRDLAALILLLIPAGLGAAALVALPYPVFESMVDDRDVGRSTGAFYTSVGVARILAPLLVGAAIDLARSWIPGTGGYPVIWPLCGTLILLGALTMRLASASGPGD